MCLFYYCKAPTIRPATSVHTENGSSLEYYGTPCTMAFGL